jgi:methionyl-tRNA formyltransferase
MRVCIAGKNNIAVDVCKYLLSLVDKSQVFVMINKSDTGRDGFQRSFRRYAEMRGIPIVSLDMIYDWDDLIFLSLEFDKIIKPHLFKSTYLYNIHFSLLPKYKGMYTSALPLLYGEKESGVTLHIIDNGIDTGDIIAQERIVISEDENAKSLYLKYIASGTKLVKEKLPLLLAGKYQSVPQNGVESTYYSKKTIDYQNLIINTSCTAYQLVNQIKAFSFRDYQLPEISGYCIFYAHCSNEKSTCVAGTLLEENEFYIKVSTIDYDVLLYKDRFNLLLDCCIEGNLYVLKSQEDIAHYLDEREPLHGWSLLMVAAYHNNKNVISYLLSMGANINAQNNNGTTVLMYAKDACLRIQDNALLFYLIEHGADPFLRDFSGNNLFDYVKQENNTLYSQLIDYYD